MKIEQLYTGCLAEAAYYIESEGEAAIIDPLRETKPYIAKAEKNNAKIKYVFETHFHADFVSGHIDLAKKTGAKIIFGPTAQPNYEVLIAKDQEEFKIGKLTIRVLHTPGHTPESTTFLLIDEKGIERCIFTGDTLFIGDVGRPDLALKGNLTENDLAGMLYESLHTKIMTLPDNVIVYPGHGAGSACGKNMSKETFDTLGNQKQFNYALKAKSKEAFIKEVTTGLAKPPQYFPKNAIMNKMGYDSIDEVMKRGTNAFSADAFEAAAEKYHALVLDVRKAADFSKAFIPNSINIGIDGQFAPWVGALISDLKQVILIVADKGREEETVLRLARVGYDNCIGYLEGGIENWIKAGKQTDTIKQIDAETFVEKANTQMMAILDVRKNSEYLSEHMKNVENIPLDLINDSMGSIDRHKTYYIHCAGGYRSMIAASILKARGFENVIDVVGGFKAIKDTGKANITDYVCPTTFL
jgi:glyoxylase-like metal-dependent hydrolase (beta-lactamase superfamily II)/rhodanese-related sulfurtransferase